MTRIILSGANGHMGRVLDAMIKKKDGVCVVAGFDINTATVNDYPVYASPKDFEGEADVVVDFSHPSSLSGLLAFAKERRIPCVICTTGLSAEQKKEIVDASNEVAMFFSANMSLGVNLVMELLRRAAGVLGQEYDIEIIEKHHNRKIDAPSGTALAMADEIASALPAPAEYVFDRHSVRKSRSRSEIGISSVRGGNIVGEHEVIFAGPNETIEIKHSAASRDVFAEGAVMAAEFVADKGPGLYTMRDLVDAIK